MGLHLPPASDLWTAIDLYLQRAYPDGCPTPTVQQRLDKLRAAGAEPWQSDVFEKVQGPNGTQYKLRLGNSSYPHMKLAIEPSPDQSALLAADPCPAGHYNLGFLNGLGGPLFIMNIDYLLPQILGAQDYLNPLDLSLFLLRLSLAENPRSDRGHLRTMMGTKNRGHHLSAEGRHDLHEFAFFVYIQGCAVGRKPGIYPGGDPGREIRSQKGGRQKENIGLPLENQVADDPGVGQP